MARFAKNSALYTDVLPEGADTINIPVRETSYGLESDDAQVLLSGRFAHNSGRFGVALFSDGTKCLTARAAVISNRAVAPTAEPIDVEDGDFLEIEMQVYQIRDDVRLANPRLYPVDWS